MVGLRNSLWIGFQGFVAWFVCQLADDGPPVWLGDRLTHYIAAMNAFPDTSAHCRTCMHVPSFMFARLYLQLQVSTAATCWPQLVAINWWSSAESVEWIWIVWPEPLNWVATIANVIASVLNQTECSVVGRLFGSLKCTLIVRTNSAQQTSTTPQTVWPECHLSHFWL